MSAAFSLGLFLLPLSDVTQLWLVTLLYTHRETIRCYRSDNRSPRGPYKRKGDKTDIINQKYAVRAKT